MSEAIAFWPQTFLGSFISSGHVLNILRAGLVLVLALVAVPLMRRALHRMMAQRLGLAMTLLIQRLSSYVLWGFALAWTLNELGFDLNMLLGTAGVLGVALSISSQTSIGQLISGLFIIWEKPFSPGDVIVVEGTTGEVLAVDPLSVKIRTPDNLYVRIPNEAILKGKVSNLSRFPIRRYDVEIGVAFDAKIDEVQTVLFALAERNPLCLEDPKPLFIVLGYSESSLRLQFSVWSKREQFLDLRNSIYADIKQAFEKANIAMPYPHRTLVAESSSQALAVRVVHNDRRAQPQGEA